MNDWQNLVQIINNLISFCAKEKVIEILDVIDFYIYWLVKVKFDSFFIHYIFLS